ncbi:MAG: SurA N-terminal domain-containing protein [FCB group bacterium]|nr:SurA N-terminal domain-containing protein [FCB group bacterium]
MMDQMRRNMPLILWILVIAFVLTIIFSWGMGGFKEEQKQGIVGMIDGQEIKYDFFEDVVNQQISMYTQRAGIEPQDQTIRDLRNQAWETLIREIVLHNEAQKLGITVSDGEIIDQVTNNPPEFIQMNEYFQTEGQFDLSKYHAFLQNPANRDQVIYLEENYRRTMLERKLLTRVTGSVKVTNNELRRRFEERNVTGTAKYLFFQADSMLVDSAVITHDEIQKYYYDHVNEYFVPEKRRIVYVKFDNETTEEDSVNYQDLAEEIKNRLDGGEDFGYLAMIFSDHHTAPDSGNLGWMPKMRLEQEADSLVWKTPVGEFFGPLYTRYGAHFYKVLDREFRDGELQSDLQILQIKFLPSADTKDMIANKAAAYVDEIKENDFTRTAEAYGVVPDTSGYFMRDGSFVPGLGKVVSQAEWAFENPAGSTSEVYPLRNGWLVFKITGMAEERFSELEEVRDDIFEKIYIEKQAEAAWQACSEFTGSLADRKSWADEAELRGYEVQTTEHEFRYGDFIKNVGRDAAFSASLFRSQPGELYGPIKGENGSFLIELLEVTPFDSVEFERGKAEHLPTLLQNKQELAFKKWYEQLKEEADIEDYRYMYYRKM